MPSEYINLLKRALSQIEPDYFKLATTYRRNGIVRERIFCYELYHQMRLLMPIDRSLLPHNELTLHGEITKSGHRDFAKQDQANPDFVFHTPVHGRHGRDLRVIQIDVPRTHVNERPYNPLDARPSNSVKILCESHHIHPDPQCFQKIEK